MRKLSSILLVAGIIAFCGPIASANRSHAGEKTLTKGVVVRLEKIKSISLGPEPNILTTATSDGAVHLFEISSGRRVRELAANDDQAELRAVTASSNGKYLACCGPDVSLRDAKQGNQIRSWSGRLMSGPMAFSADNRFLAVSGWGHVVEVFQIDKDEGPKSIKGDSQRTGGQIASLSWSPNGNILLATTSNGHSYLWDADSGVLSRKWENASSASASAFSPNGHVLAIMVGELNRHPKLCLVETMTGLVRWETTLPRSTMAMAFSTNGRLLAINDESHDGTKFRFEPYAIGIRDVATGDSLACWTSQKAPIDFLAFSFDSNCLISRCWLDTVCIWDMKQKLQAKPRPSSRMEKQVLDQIWTTLANDKGTEVQKAIWTIVDAPKDSVAFLRRRITEAPVILASEEMARLLAGLSSSDLKTRVESSSAFLKLGKNAEPFLRLSLESQLPLETTRRLENLLVAIPRPENTLKSEKLRLLRTLEVLELIGSPEAKEVIIELSRRESHPYVRQVAKAALERVAKQSR